MNWLTLLTPVISSALVAEPIRDFKVPSYQDISYLQSLADKAWPIITRRSANEVDASIKEVALRLAFSIGNYPEGVNQMDKILQQSYFSEFDRDILLQDIANNLIGSENDFEKKALSRFGFWAGLDEVPFIQIEFLHGRMLEDVWVLAMEYSTPEDQLTTLTGFNTMGIKRQFTRAEARTQASIIVSISEKVPAILQGYSLQAISSNTEITDRSTPSLVINRLDIQTQADFAGGSEWFVVITDIQQVQSKGIYVSQNTGRHPTHIEFALPTEVECEAIPFYFFVVEKDFNPWRHDENPQHDLQLTGECHGNPIKTHYLSGDLAIDPSDQVYYQVNVTQRDVAEVQQQGVKAHWFVNNQGLNHDEAQ